MYKIVFTKPAQKDLKLIAQSKYRASAYKLLEILENNPYQKPYEGLLGQLHGAYSRRINIQHRLVYKIDEETKTVIIISMWGHYEDN